MIRQVLAKKAGLELSVRVEPDRRIPYHNHRVLVLQPTAGQVPEKSGQRGGGPPRQSVELQRIGCKRCPLPQGSNQRPRMAPVDWLILARGYQAAALRMLQGSVVDVLADEVFVIAHGPVGSERHVLCV